MGPVPPEVIEAERMRQAIGRTMLRQLVTPSDRSRVADIQENYAEIAEEQLLGDYHWYTTLLFEFAYWRLRSLLH
jgi:hypothetical protein